MMGVLELVLWLLTLLVGCAALVVAVEAFAALLPIKEKRLSASKAPTAAVIIPAHNEADSIGSTVRAINEQLGQNDRVLVVADNCDDATVSNARSAGAEVAERSEPDLRGKGYALAFGLAQLVRRPPDVVVIFDADSRPERQSVSKLARMAHAAQHPMQAIYVLSQPAKPSLKSYISQWAFLMKNEVRLRGLAWLNLPVPLTGTGMAFPWTVLKEAPLASGNIVEDMQLGIDLALQGTPPKLCPHARVTGTLPCDVGAAKGQRTRWEHGHLRTLTTQCPPLVAQAIRQRRPELLAMALDLAVPPLSLLCLTWLVVTALAVVASLAGAGIWPTITLLTVGVLLGLSLLATWGRFARRTIPAQVLIAVPLYILWKVPIYLAFLLKRQHNWIRTPRQ